MRYYFRPAVSEEMGRYVVSVHFTDQAMLTEEEIMAGALPVHGHIFAGPDAEEPGPPWTVYRSRIASVTRARLASAVAKARERCARLNAADQEASLDLGSILVNGGPDR